METSCNEKFRNSLYHQALIQWNVHENREIPEPVQTPFYSEEVYNIIKAADNKDLPIATMATKEWYNFILSSVIYEPDTDNLIPCRVSSKRLDENLVSGENEGAVVRFLLLPVATPPSASSCEGKTREDSPDSGQPYLPGLWSYRHTSPCTPRLSFLQPCLQLDDDWPPEVHQQLDCGEGAAAGFHPQRGSPARRASTGLVYGRGATEDMALQTWWKNLSSVWGESRDWGSHQFGTEIKVRQYGTSAGWNGGLINTGIVPNMEVPVVNFGRKKFLEVPAINWEINLKWTSNSWDPAK